MFGFRGYMMVQEVVGLSPYQNVDFNDSWCLRIIQYYGKNNALPVIKVRTFNICLKTLNSATNIQINIINYIKLN